MKYISLTNSGYTEKENKEIRFGLYPQNAKCWWATIWYGFFPNYIDNPVE